MQREEDAIRGLYEKLLESWNQRRAEQMAALIDDRGIVVGFDGRRAGARKLTEEGLSARTRLATFRNDDVAY